MRTVAYYKGCLASLSAKELEVGAAEHKSFDFRPLRRDWPLLEAAREKRRVRAQ